MNMLERARLILLQEAEAITSLALDERFEQAVNALLTCRGKVFTTGVGKAGHVAQKAASTFSTTGTPSVFLHPAESSHGDVGVVAEGDVLICFSNSGGTREVVETVHFCRHLNICTVITICASEASPLGEESDIVLPIGRIQEACPLGLTPSASTAVMIALSDALALTVMAERGFTKEDFALRHHGGYLGKKSRE
ncbi:MAG: SIS domain-containing protein [Deltaproteobacteria bacterium]|nr:SIS domain-containing protein [Deltaproteobacteria bacterium]